MPMNWIRLFLQYGNVVLCSIEDTLIRTHWSLNLTLLPVPGKQKQSASSPAAERRRNGSITSSRGAYETRLKRSDVRCFQEIVFRVILHHRSAQRKAILLEYDCSHGSAGQSAELQKGPGSSLQHLIPVWLPAVNLKPLFLTTTYPNFPAALRKHRLQIIPQTQ